MRRHGAMTSQMTSQLMFIYDVDIAYPDASKSKTRAVSDKLYICSFDGCSAVFSSSRRLRHHLCYHTGKVFRNIGKPHPRNL
uniref:C2H2-type domain-containing protein n=1 Tax=Eptatretus burgeri TaxID=7764 RepID=A0A8C4Q6H8_EPTBU